MNKIIAFFFFACISSSYGQDSIFFNNHALGVKIIELNKKGVKYTHTDSPEGPIYSLSRQNIDCIKYANGKIETFYHPPEPVSKPTTPKPISSKSEIRRFIIGYGLNTGIFDPSKYNKFIRQNTDSEPNLKDEITAPNFGFKAILGYRITKSFYVNIAGEWCSSELNWLQVNGLSSPNYSLKQESYGLFLNKQFPLKRHFGLNLSAGSMYHKLYLDQPYNENVFSGYGVGYRLQGGVDIYAGKALTIQFLAGGEYAQVSASHSNNYNYNQIDNLNYSGLIFTFNMIFSN